MSLRDRPGPGVQGFPILFIATAESIYVQRTPPEPGQGPLWEPWCPSTISWKDWGKEAWDPTRLLCPWDSPGKNTGVGCHFFLQGISPTQGSNLGLLYCRQILYHLSITLAVLAASCNPDLTDQ